MSIENHRPDEHHDGKIRIHIDQEPYHSPNPTTGKALYELGHVKPGLWLYREIHGNHEDLAIQNDEDLVQLRPDEHFHTGEPHSMTIIVAGSPHTWSKHSISYVEVVTLFDPTFPQHPDTTYSVTYKRGHSSRPDGILVQGASVKVKDGMVFNVSTTGQS